MSVVLDTLPLGVRLVKRYRERDLVECTHAERTSYEHPGSSEWPLRVMCDFCKGDGYTTQGWTLPVKRIVKLTGEALEPVQETLL